MNDSASEFTRLLFPINIEEFLKKYWEKGFLHLKRADKDYYTKYLTVESIEKYWQNQHLSPYFLSLRKDGSPVPTEEWTSATTSISKKNTTQSVNVKKILNLFNEGATVVINAAESAIESLIKLSRLLENELGCAVQTNIYLTPPNSQGFEPHFDAHDVFILQIHGQKRWFLYDSPTEKPLHVTSVKNFNYSEQKPKQIVDLSQGDFLYIPRGWVHSAKAGSTASIHVTLGIMVKHWTDLIKMLAKQVESEAVFRQTLPLAINSDEEKEKFVEQFTEQLHNLINQVNLSEIYQNNFYDGQKTLVQNRLTDILKINELTENTIVQRRPFLNFKVEQNDEWITIYFEGQEIVLPIFLTNSLDKFFQSEPFIIHQIEGIPTTTAKISLVKRFINEGFLTIISID